MSSTTTITGNGITTPAVSQTNHVPAGQVYLSPAGAAGAPLFGPLAIGHLTGVINQPSGVAGTDAQNTISAQTVQLGASYKATVHLSLQEIAGFSPSAKAYGAMGDGSTNDNTGFQNFVLNAGPNALVPPGNYILTNTIYTISGQTMTWLPGAKYTGGLVIGATDSSVFGTAFGLTANLSNAAGVSPYVMFLQYVTQNDAGTTSWEQGGLYINAVQAAVSAASGSPSFTKDSAPIQIIHTIGSGNTQGRIWGADFNLVVPAGTDGYVPGVEISVTNDGVAQPASGQPNSKHALNLLASGSLDDTGAIIINQSTGATARWATGIIFFQPAIGTNAWGLRPNGATLPAQDIAYCDANGNIVGVTLGGDASAATFKATNATVARAIASVADLTPEWFGAVGNGIADDTAAINAYIAKIKAIAPAGHALVYNFRAGAKYLVSGPLNFGFSTAPNTNPAAILRGHGATVIGTTTGPALVDFINFGAGTSLENLTIIGNAGGTQGCGLLYGTSSQFVGNFVTRNLTIIGYFAYACEINRGADICSEYTPLLYNQTTTGIGQAIGSAGFGLIIDSQGQWPITSAITTLSAITSGNSIQYHRYASSDTGAAGSPYWFDTNVSPRLYDCYCNSVGSTAVPIAVIYILQTLQAGAPWMHFDVHGEKIGSLSCAFNFKAPWATSGSQASIYYDHWYHQDQGYEGNTYVYEADANISLIRLSGFTSDTLFEAGGVMFNTPSVFQVIGLVRHIAPSQWNAPALFSGTFESGIPYSSYTWGNGVATHRLTSIQGGYPLVTLVGTGALNFGGPAMSGTLLLDGGAFIGQSSGVLTAAGTTFGTAVQATNMVTVIEGSGGGVIMPNVIGVWTTYISQASGAVTIYGPGGGVVATINAGVTTPLMIFRYNSTTYFQK